MKDRVQSIKDQLRESGFKLTPQRRSVVEALLDAEGKHLSCEEIYDAVKVNCPEIGLATVYRTLLMLDKIGCVTKLSLGSGSLRYELCPETKEHNHHHLICKKCGKIIEVKLDLLDSLEHKIETEYDFMILNHDLKFLGLCSHCK